MRQICEARRHLELSPVGSKAAKKEYVTARSEWGCIEIRGARQNNLKGIDLDLPLGKLTVVTGPSGSGKSSLAFETIYAEGQRRYVETFSPYMRQFLDRMDKPRVDEIRGIPPAIAIEQSNPVRSSRSTVGTMTDINDYVKMFSSPFGWQFPQKRNHARSSSFCNSKGTCAFGSITQLCGSMSIQRSTGWVRGCRSFRTESRSIQKIARVS